MGSGPVTSQEFLDIQATMECGFTLKRARDMIRTYSYQMAAKYLRIKTIFSKNVNLMKYQVQTYMLVKTRNLLFVNFPGVSSHYTMESILNAKKKKRLKLYLIIISALEIKINKHKSSQLSFSTKNFSFFSKCFCSTSSTLFLPFHFTCAFDR